MRILKRKFLQNSLVKLSYKNSCVKFDAFSKENGSFIFTENRGAQKRKCLHFLRLYFNRGDILSEADAN